MRSLGHAAPVVLLWVPIGAALAALHLWLLWRALAKAELLGPARAGTRLATTMPLRMLLAAPILACAARAGLWACLGLVAGSLICRWITVWWMRVRPAGSIRCHTQGQIRGH